MISCYQLGTTYYPLCAFPNSTYISGPHDTFSDALRVMRVWANRTSLPIDLNIYIGPVPVVSIGREGERWRPVTFYGERVCRIVSTSRELLFEQQREAAEVAVAYAQSHGMDYNPDAGRNLHLDQLI